MIIAVMLTYRCNSKCSMCNVWKYPSIPEEEISLETLDKISENVEAINLTGGEPTLRRDLGEIIDLLYTKVQNLEISSNGLLPKKLEPIIKRYPDIKIRFSLEGSEKTNNMIRGEKNGYRTKVDGLARLRELGGTDLGFAAVIQDDNVADLVDLFRFTEKNGYELSTSTLHNAFQFHKHDIPILDRLPIVHQIEKLIIEQLKTNNIKNWFRAYLNLGLIAKVLGNRRLLACKAGSDSAIIDPWSDVFACNVRPDLHMGNLENQTWSEITSGPKALQVLREVDKCQQNCWMAGTAKTAIWNSRFTKLPRLEPFAWVVHNKTRLLLGKNVGFQHDVHYPVAIEKNPAPGMSSYLNTSIKRRVQTKSDQHYSHLGRYINK